VRAKNHAGFFKKGNKIIVELVTMPVPFADNLFPVSFFSQGAAFDRTWMGSEAQSPANPGYFFLTGQVVNNRAGSIGIKFGAVSTGYPGHIAGEFDHRTLHPETQAEKWYFVFPGQANGVDFPFYAPLSGLIPGFQQE